VKEQTKCAATGLLYDGVPVGGPMSEIEHNRRRVADDETREGNQRVL
jgi:hypothetical protein